jgi:hypothetical protein
MTTLSAFIDELEKAKGFEEDRIDGYTELTGIPAPLLSDDTRSRLLAANEWSRGRVNLLKAAIDALTSLGENKYPERPKQPTTPETIKELTELERLFDLAVDEFTDNPIGATTGTATVEVRPI